MMRWMHGFKGCFQYAALCAARASSRLSIGVDLLCGGTYLRLPSTSLHSET